MKQHLFILFSLLISITTHIQAVFFITPEQPNINADSFVLMDMNSKKIIASKNMHKQKPPASLTKLMTSYVVLKRLNEGFASIDDIIVISKKAWKTGGSRSFLKVGSKVKLKTLLKGMIIQSGNDASVALAEHIAGTEMTFVALMNKYANMLNMTGTNFESASGLPAKGQVTTSYDMALLSQALINEFPKYYKWYGQKYFTHNKIKQPNRNKLLWSDKSVDGLKTGYTKKAGYCLVASAKRLGMRLISVVLDANSIRARELQTRQLLDYGFRFFETSKASIKKHNIAIYKGDKNEIAIGLSDNGNNYLTIERGKFEKLTKKLVINTPLIAPIKKGEKVGELQFMFKEKVIQILPLVALADVKEAGFFSKIFDSIALWF